MKKLKRKTKVTKPYKYKIELSGETIITGPGTVPTSGASVTKTSISEMVSLLRKASRNGIFELKENLKYGSFQDTTK